MKPIWKRLIFVAVIHLISLYALWPSINWYLLMNRNDRVNLSAAQRIKLRNGTLSLGLDLQGGIRLVYEVDRVKTRVNTIERSLNVLIDDLTDKGNIFLDWKVKENEVDITLSPGPNPFPDNKDMKNRYPIFNLQSGPTATKEKKKFKVKLGINQAMMEKKFSEASEQAVSVIRNRIDQFGVREPSIHLEGTRQKRIVVELPGVDDPARAEELVGKTAQLQFRTVRPDEDLTAIVQRLQVAFPNLKGKLQLTPSRGDEGKDCFVLKKDYDTVKRTLDAGGIERAFPKLSLKAQLFLSKPETYQSKEGHYLYVLNRKIEMTGENLQDAFVQYDQFSRPKIAFLFNSNGAEQFGKITQRNLKKRLAIVLDGIVQSAPVIQSRITRSGEITGSFTEKEAKDLKIVLKAGALPASIVIEEKRSVGPALGWDSIQKGYYACMIGIILVLLTLLVRYRIAGLVPVLSLSSTLFLVLGIMAQFNATMTLPGIAGIILTIGMSVDANVLIFERLRDEIKLGKTIRAVVDTSYSRAKTAIYDSNLTTFLTAIVLYSYGTGPIKGFAVTLSIGILTSMFTAIYMTRIAFDAYTQNPNTEGLMGL